MQALDAARGEWIGLWIRMIGIHPDMYEKLLAAAEKNDADMAICNILRVDVQRVPLEEQGQQVPDGVFSREEILSRFREIPFHLAYNRVYRKHIFQNLRFPEGKLNEDVYIVTAVLDQVNRVPVSRTICTSTGSPSGQHYDQEKGHCAIMTRGCGLCLFPGILTVGEGV